MNSRPIVCSQCRESMPDIAWNHPCPHWRWTPENVAAIESEIIILKAELASLHDDARCGHEQRFLQWENHGKPIICTLCEIERLTARLAEAEATLARITLAASESKEKIVDCAQGFLGWKTISDLRSIVEAAKGGRDE